MDGKVNTLKMVPIIADDDFIKVFNLEMIKGESLEADYDNYWGGGALQRTVVINESAWKAMKVADPIGTEFRLTDTWWGHFNYRIVGW